MLESCISEATRDSRCRTITAGKRRGASQGSGVVEIVITVEYKNIHDHIHCSKCSVLIYVLIILDSGFFIITFEHWSIQILFFIIILTTSNTYMIVQRS